MVPLVRAVVDVQAKPFAPGFTSLALAESNFPKHPNTISLNEVGAGNAVYMRVTVLSK
jgi:hypothetical protein